MSRKTTERIRRKIIDQARGDGGRNGAPATEGAPAWESPIPLSEAPAVPAFPLDVLPAGLSDCAAEIAWAMNCPPDFVAVPMLALASGAIANSRHLAVTRSHIQPAIIYAATIGRPGSAKSPPVKLLRRPFDQAQRRAINTYQQALEAWENAAEDERGPRPVLHRCVVGDITTESLGVILTESPRGVLVIRDELAGLLAGMNQYKAGKGHDRQVYLAMWAGETILIDRKSDRDRRGVPLSVYDPFVSIAGTIQPAVLDRLRGDGRDRLPPPDDGFLDRFLFTYPEDVPAAGEQWREVSEAAQQVWDGTIEALLGLSMVREDDGAQRPYLLHLTSEGRRSWERFTAAHAAELNSEDFPDHLRGAWSKLRGYCARLALVLCCLRNTQRTGPFVVKGQDVTGEDLDGATRLVAYFKGHAQKVYHALDADSRIGNARRALHCLARHPDLDNFTRRDLYLHLRGYFKRPEALDLPLRLLAEHRYLRATTENRPGKPGVNPERYQVNPFWDRAHFTHITRDSAAEGESVQSVQCVRQPGDDWPDEGDPETEG